MYRDEKVYDATWKFDDIRREYERLNEEPRITHKFEEIKCEIGVAFTDYENVILLYIKYPEGIDILKFYVYDKDDMEFYGMYCKGEV